MKKLIAMLIAAVMMLTFAACGSASSAAPSSQSEAVSASVETGEAKSFKVGIIQLVEHNALDAACQGFQDELKESMSEKGISVEFDVQNAQGEQSNCVTIATKFVNDKVDLILAIATPAAQAAAQATTTIPILVTAVTDPASAGVVESNEVPGRNVSGTSDMNPIEQQISLLQKLCPDAETVGIMYCSSEDNSILQAELAQEVLEAAGLKVEVMTAADSNEIQSVTTALASRVDAIYIPTDNLFASAMPTVAMVANPAGVPVFCGESNMVEAGGLATYGLDYYNLGKLTATQAFDILVNDADIATIPIGYSSESDLTLTLNEETVAALGIEVPADLQ